MAGTDMSIGADTALHRIAEAVDGIGATAASHQRTFVVEVMGRHCGYLALMSGLATGADAVLIPEAPPAGDSWTETLPRRLRAGRDAGRRDSIVLVAEGAIDSDGRPITADSVKQILEERMEEEVRVTILGHVQRGGAPSAYDRLMGTLLGHAAVHDVMEADPVIDTAAGGRAPQPDHPAAVGRVRRGHPGVLRRLSRTKTPTRRCGFGAAASRTISTPCRRCCGHCPTHPPSNQRRLRLAVLSSGGPLPG